MVTDANGIVKDVMDLGCDGVQDGPSRDVQRG